MKRQGTGQGQRERQGQSLMASICSNAKRIDEHITHRIRHPQMRVAGVALQALRLSYTGELGWELYLPREEMERLYSAILDKGQDLGEPHANPTS